MNEELAVGYFSSPAELVSRFRSYLDAHGIARGWLALELNDFGNETRARAFVEACEPEPRIQAFGWLTRNFTAAGARAAVDAAGVSAFIAEGEIPAQYLATVDGETQALDNPQAQDWAALAEAFRDFPGDCAVATSWAPFQSYVWNQSRWELWPDARRAAPLIRSGWYVLPYVYPAENPGQTIEATCGYSAHFTHESQPTALEPGQGWYDPEPVLGVYGGYHVEDFPTRERYAGFSLWDAGEVL